MAGESKRLPLWQAGGFAIGAVALYVAMNYLMVTDVLALFEERGLRTSFMYIAWMICGFMVFSGLILAASWRVLAALLPLFLLSLATNYSYITLGKRALSYEVMEWLPGEIGQFHNAWGEFPRQIGLAITQAVLALVLFVAIRYVVRRRVIDGFGFIRTKGAGWAALLVFIGFHGASMALQPPQLMAETNLFVFGIPALMSSPPALRPVPIAPERQAIVDKVVLVVDESVTYGAYKQVVAPLLNRLPIFDFGEAASTANCSAPSNALLRWGIERPRLREGDYDPRSNPTIWAYARKAGYRTVLIDGQSTGAVQNYLRPKEFALIDEFVPAHVGQATDVELAALLEARLKRPGREFIYVVKYGTHFPYEMNYPKGITTPDAGRDVKYAAAIRYSTAQFFSRLNPALVGTDLLMVYTSDHGQAHDSLSTHCNPDPSDAEYSVPLVVVTASPPLRLLFTEGNAMHHRASHLNIFPTLLYAFGYSRNWAEETYGPTLAGPPASYITYVSLGWSPRVSRAKRQTVDTDRFVETATFPRRATAN